MLGQQRRRKSSRCFISDGLCRNENMYGPRETWHLSSVFFLSFLLMHFLTLSPSGRANQLLTRLISSCRVDQSRTNYPAVPAANTTPQRVCISVGSSSDRRFTFARPQTWRVIVHRPGATSQVVFDVLSLMESPVYRSLCFATSSLSASVVQLYCQQ